MKTVDMTSPLSRRRGPLAACSMLLLAGFAVNAHADVLGSVSEGQLYARATCAECHSVEPVTDDISPNYAAPRFMDIANTPGMTERALGVSLQTPHETMPDLIIPEEDRDDIIAYIMSLKIENPL